MARRKRKRRRPRANGRRVERDVYNNLVKAKPNYFIFRFNESRFKDTPADLYISTRKYNVLVEAKSTITKFIAKANVRPKQLADLKKFQALNKRNISIVLFYYRGPKFILVNIKRLANMKSRITYEEAVEHGVEVKNWKSFHTYLERIYKHGRMKI